MRILCKIDQTAALKAGIDAPRSTEQIEIDPATMTEQERDELAAILVDGHDATRYDRLTLTTPSADGLRDALRQRIAEREQAAAEKQAERERVAALTAAAVANPKTRKVTVHAIRRNGEPTQVSYSTRCEPQGSAEGTEPYIDAPYMADFGPHADAVERIKAEQDRITAELLQQAIADLERQEAGDALAVAEYDVIYSRLPESMRDRHAAGYADDDEIHRAMRSLARQDAGYGDHEPWDDSSLLRSLTDDEYTRLREIEAAAPKGAEVEPRECWDDIETPVDDDGEAVETERANIRRQAVISWRIGSRHSFGRGLTVKAVQPLG